MSLDLVEQKRAISLREFEEVFTDFLAGHVSVAQLQTALVEVLNTNAGELGEIQDQVDGAMRAGRLPEQTWEQLNRSIDQARAEQRAKKTASGSPANTQNVDPPVLTRRATQSDIDAEITETPFADDLADVQSSGAWAGNKVPTAAATGVHRIKSAAGTNQVGTDGQLPPGTVLCDRYVLVSQSAKGNMGRVYKALDRHRKESGAASPWVAAKLINPAFGSRKDAIQALEQEAIHGSKLDHPNVVRSYDFNQDGELYFICMEWLEGESLRMLLDRAGDEALAHNQGLRIIKAIAQGLDHAHSRGVIHADIKPANVFLTQSGDVKILDFGIGRAVDSKILLTQARTPAYASCEVLEGEAALATDDLFSLGVLAYRILSGRRPFGAMNALEAEASPQDLQPIDELPPHQWRALEEALAWRRSDRTADVDSFIAGFFGHEEIVMETHDPLPVHSLDEADSPAFSSASKESETPNKIERVFAATGPLRSTEATIGPANPIASAPDAPAYLQKAKWPALAAGVVGLVLVGTIALLSQDKPDPSAAAKPSVSEDGWTASSDSTTLEEVSVVQFTRIDADEALPLSEAGGNTTATSPTTPLVSADKPHNASQETTEDFSGPETDASGTRVQASVANQQAFEETNRSKQVVGESRGIEATPAEASLPLENTESLVTATAAAESNQKPKEATSVEPAVATAAGTGLPSMVQTPQNKLPSEQVAVTDGRAEATSQIQSLPLARTEPVAAEVSADSAITTSDGAETFTETPNTTAAALGTKTDSGSLVPSAEPVLASTIETAMVAPGDGTDSPEPALQSDEPLSTIDDSTPQKPKRPTELATPSIEALPLSALEFERYVEPRIPRRAAARGITGWVNLEFNITATGETIDIVVVDSEPADVFTNAALRAVERWRFKPRIVAGEMVPTRSNVRLRFE